MSAPLTAEQRHVLLQPVQSWRVHYLDGQSHLAAWDVVAHLNRVFGFEGWDKSILDLELVYENVVPDGQRVKVSVGYRCTLRLTVRNPDGEVVKVIEDAAMGTATNQRNVGDAHDLAVKSAVSYALKRCAKDLGDQFGLSLYNKGQETACVQRVFPYAPAEDMSIEGEVHGDGIDEGDDGFGAGRGEGDEAVPAAAERPGPRAVREPAPAKPAKPEAVAPAEKPEAPPVDDAKAQAWQGEIEAATEIEGDDDDKVRSVKAIWREVQAHGALDWLVLDLASEQQKTLRELMVHKVSRIEVGAA